MEVGQSFLARGVDVDEDHGLRIVTGDDRLGEEIPEGGFGEAAEEVVERCIERESGAVGFADGELKSEDGREGLYFDETRRERAIGFADEAEVRGKEVGMCGLVGAAPGLGDGSERAGEVRGIVDELESEVDADARDLIEQRLRKEARGFRDGEGDVGARDGVERVEHGAEGFGAEARVEILAEGGNHENRVQRAENWKHEAGR